MTDGAGPTVVVRPKPWLRIVAAAVGVVLLIGALSDVRTQRFQGLVFVFGAFRALACAGWARLVLREGELRKRGDVFALGRRPLVVAELRSVGGPATPLVLRSPSASVAWLPWAWCSTDRLAAAVLAACPAEVRGEVLSAWLGGKRRVTQQR